MLLSAQGEPIKAALEFRNALKLKGDFVDALFALGEVEEQQGHFEQAAKIYFSVIEHAPQHFEAHVHLAYILLAAGQLDDALKYADEAMAISENDPTALVLKAAIALRLDNRGDAVHLAKDALKLKPDDADALMVLASERLMSADPAGALKLLDQSVEKNEGNIGLQVLRLTALDALGDQPGVEKLFDRLIELYPEYAGLSGWFGEMVSRQRQER